MSVSNLKKELVSYIENTEDEALLQLLKEDVQFYSQKAGTDVTDNLTDVQLEELKVLAEEDEQKDTQTLEEFKKATDKWRIR